MKYLALIVVGGIILSTSPALGEAITGSQFKQRCSAVKKVNRVPVSEEETVYATFCLGYITGFVDHYELLDNEHNLQNKTFCLSDSGSRLTNTQLVETVLDYLDKFPEKQKLPLNQAVSLSLRQAFPCDTDKNKK